MPENVSLKIEIDNVFIKGFNVTDDVIKIAKICHETNRAWCEVNGDFSQKSWEEAEEWQRDSAITGVIFAIENPDASDSAQHDAWCAEKFAMGWQYGTIKDAEKKTHPCLVQYDELPEEQRIKDTLFRSVVFSVLPQDFCRTHEPVSETKRYRQDLDGVLQEIKNSPRQSRERSLAITKIQEGIMWLGMDLKAQRETNPYPESYNPDSNVIEPTADRLKM